MVRYTCSHGDCGSLNRNVCCFSCVIRESCSSPECDFDHDVIAGLEQPHLECEYMELILDHNDIEIYEV